MDHIHWIKMVKVQLELYFLECYSESNLATREGGSKTSHLTITDHTESYFNLFQGKSMALWLWTQRIVAPVNTELWMLKSLKYLNPQSLTADLDVCRKQNFDFIYSLSYTRHIISFKTVQI